ncbi:DUF6923 family protein [Pseudooceanicola algae]|uniref:DUF6923 domain-containing protein n=1 Tax=Pseudooceanicola algae TaxID=1537215 RepID=A0A418SHY5_9RHOB|nr:calcium-binding protein [Pseudooceanicola algae]QPM90506.1 hypothetical protein PSAL_017450 [Pseudooceanicola algae]
MTQTSQINAFLGTSFDDAIQDGFQNDLGVLLDEDTDQIDFVNGREGDDVISTGLGHDLAAGDMVGDEWSFDGVRWVYDAAKVVVSDRDLTHSFDDTIETGAGNDVLLGNGGNDMLSSGAGDDIVNAGRGDDVVFGGDGADILNLEDGNDYAEGGLGADIVNGGAGDDVIYGDLKGDNLLVDATAAANTFSSLAASGGWTFQDDYGQDVIAQSASTEAGETYTIAFDLAANLSGGRSSAMVEVLWNGEVVETVQTTSGAYQTFEVDVESTGETGDLSFRAVEPDSGVDYNFDGPIISYDSTLVVDGAATDVAAFAAGQAKLYQVIGGQLNVFDTETKTYTAVGEQPDFLINATGFNVEDDLIYGVAKSAGTDSVGNAVGSTDIVAIDANGATYRIGEGFYGDFVGDFDDSGNLWTFHTTLDRVSVVDVSDRDADGNPAIQYFHFPAGMFKDRTFDMAYDASSEAFYAVVSPGSNGGNGKVVKIDVSAVDDGGQPTFTEVAITGTLYGDAMEQGMSSGAYGAVFFDGEGNLYYGLNKGDHDLDKGTDASGAIFKVNVDWSEGEAYSEFMSEAPSTGSNDGAADPRSSDPFAEIDADAAVLLREPTLTKVEGGNDSLRGGEGNDEIHGNEGDDEINGGTGNDTLYGDQGDDNISGAAGDDSAFGGVGNDSLRGEAGDDLLSGGEGTDYLSGGAGADELLGGAGSDKLVGGLGSDVIEGGAGDDHLWGGEWSADEASDTFVFSAGSGKDFVHDFEADIDLIDLTALEVDFATVMAATQDQGWATIINLGAFETAEAEDKIILKSVAMADLDESTFLV